MSTADLAKQLFHRSTDSNRFRCSQIRILLKKCLLVNGKVWLAVELLLPTAAILFVNLVLFKYLRPLTSINLNNILFESKVLAWNFQNKLYYFVEQPEDSDLVQSFVEYLLQMSKKCRL